MKYVFRNVDYFNRAIYFILTLFAAELIALFNQDEIANVINAFLQETSIPRWAYHGVRLLEAILVGGSFVIVLTFGSIFLLLLFLKYIAQKNNKKTTHLFNAHLRRIKDFINDFQNVTAYKISNDILTNLEDSYLTTNEINTLSARLYHLMGLTRIKDGDLGRTFKFHIEAYLREPTNSSYQERACVSYYRLDEKEKAITLARRILESGRSSARAYAILIVAGVRTIEDVPQPIQHSQEFKSVYGFLILAEPNSEDHLNKLLKDELTQYPTPDEITMENIDFWAFVAMWSFEFGMKKVPLVNLDEKPDYAGNALIVYANKLFSKIYRHIFEKEFLTGTGMGILLHRYFLLSDYQISGSKDSLIALKSLFEKGLNHKERFDQSLRDQILVSLHQTGEYQIAIDFADRFPNDKNPALFLLKFSAYVHLNDFNRAKENFKEYYRGTKEIHELELRNFLMLVNHAHSSEFDLSAFYIDVVASKHFAKPVFQAIAFSYAHRFIDGHRDEIKKLTPEFLKSYVELSVDLRYTILLVLRTIDELPICNELIEKYHDWRCEDLPLTLLAENLIILKERSELLLQLLGEIRRRMKNEKFLRAELRLYLFLANYRMVVNVCKIGVRYFSQDTLYRYFLIVALHKEFDEELQTQLTEDLLQIDFNWQQTFSLARIALESGNVELGLEMAFRVTTRNYSNTVIRLNYFHLLTMDVKIPLPKLNRIESPCSVRISSNDMVSLLDVNDETVRYNAAARTLQGKAPGDRVQILDTLTQRKQEIEVKEVLDKYSGLIAKISEQFDESPFNNMGVRSIKFGDDPADMIKKMVELFGEAGDLQKIHRDEAFSKYYRGQISFTELTRAVLHDDPFDVLLYLMSPLSDGFLSIPRKLSAKMRPGRLVIDLTTLPVLHALTKKSPNIINQKLVISQFLVDYLRDELTAASHMPQESISIGITSFGVKSHIYPPDFKGRRIKLFQELLEWVELHCEINFSFDRLDYLAKHPASMREDDWYFNYVLDTAFLALDGTLVSDDILFLRNFKSKVSICGLESFLEQTAPSAEFFRLEVLPTLIENRYLGLTLTAQGLYDAFKKPIFGRYNPFHNALQTLAYHRHYEESVIDRVIDFARLIYSDTVPMAARRQAVQSALVEVFKGLPSEKLFDLRENLLERVKEKFRFLQLHIKAVTEDLVIALKIVNSGHS